MRAWFTAAELADRFPSLPSTIRGVNLRASRESWKWRDRAGRGGGREYHISNLPGEAQAAIVLMLEREARTGTAPDPDAETGTAEPAWARFEVLPDKAKAKAREALALIQAAERLIAAGGQRRRSVYAVAKAAGIDPSTLYRKFEAVDGLDPKDRLPALAPKHQGRTSTAECSPEAWEHFKADYLRPAQPAATACYDRLQRLAEDRGWTVPSLPTLQRRIEREVPQPMLVLARQGVDALKRAYPAQDRDRSHFAALDAVNVDGHRFDVFVEQPDGTVVRPILLAWQDLYSGKIVAWRLGETESAALVRLAFADLVEQHGIPAKAYLDNGRAFASKWISGQTPNRFRFKIKPEDPEGILTALSVQVHWTTPYHGQAKPIERAFRDLCEYIAKHPRCDGAYTGNSPVDKPADHGRRSVPWAAFEELVAEEIAQHNARRGRRSAVCQGRFSFDEVFSESYARQPIRRATAEQRRMLLLAAEGVAASRTDCSITLHGNRYWSESLSHAGIGGRRVVVRFDPQRLDQPVYVYALDGRFLAAAERIEKAGFDDIEAARKHERARRSYIRAQKDGLAATRTMTALEVAERLPTIVEPDAPLPAPRVVRPVFGNTAAAAVREAEADEFQQFEDDDPASEANRLLSAGLERFREAQRRP